MKYLLILIFAIFVSACGDKHGTGIVGKILTPNIDGRYVASDKSEFIIKDGEIIAPAKGSFKEYRSAYKVVGNEIEFTFDNPIKLKIIDNKTLLLLGVVTFNKVE